ncbi:hypothetical protein WEB32_22515 [Streptomyces netropsis]|uniref:hypothetical protein n=1 Tax=Streptomyces netropsis TaxID=55404 RepID=UPI0030D26D01
MTTSLTDDSAPTAAAGIPAASADPAGPADPVKTLIQRHHLLCARAADPFELAAALEARGITDRVAAECRHRDVFSLAEEIHARVERADGPLPIEPAVPAADGSDAHGPGAFDLRAYDRSPYGWGLVGWLCCLWLVAYGLVGDRLLVELLGGRQGLALPTVTAAVAPTAVALACAVAPAAWCGYWFGTRACRALATSRGLAEFGARVRPLLLAAVGLFLALLLALLWAARTAVSSGAPPTPPGTRLGGPFAAALESAGQLAAAPAPTTPPVLAYATVAALGALLFVGRLLAAHGFGKAAVTAVLTACAAEAAPLGVLLAARLPGCGGLERPVARAAEAYGAAALPLVACAVPALALLAYSLPALSRACAHGRGDLAYAPGHIRPGPSPYAPYAPAPEA